MFAGLIAFNSSRTKYPKRLLLLLPILLLLLLLPLKPFLDFVRRSNVEVRHTTIPSSRNDRSCTSSSFCSFFIPVRSFRGSMLPSPRHRPSENLSFEADDDGIEKNKSRCDFAMGVSSPRRTHPLRNHILRGISSLTHTTLALGRY